MVDLSQNTNPYFPKWKHFNYLKHHISIISKYPSSTSENVEKIIAEALNLNVHCVKLVSGTMEGMELILKVLHKKSIGFFSPTFWGIMYVAEKENYQVLERKIDDFNEYLEKDLNYLAKKCDVVYLCNPNNPTLTYIEKQQLLKIISDYPSCHFIIDETVLEFASNFEDISLYHEIVNLSNCSILWSLSKILGVPGLRIGLVITNPSFKRDLSKFKLLYSITSIGELFLTRFSSDLSKLQLYRKKIAKNFDFLISHISKELYNEIYYKNSSFVLINLRERINSVDLTNYLRKNNILISNLDSYPDLAKNWIRISAGTKSDMKKLLKFLIKYLKKENIL